MGTDIFSGPRVVEYSVTGSAPHQTPPTLTKRYITANYKAYTMDRVLEVLKEVHPEWEIQKIYKVEKLPWED